MIHLPRRLVRQIGTLLRRIKYRRSTAGFRQHMLLQTDNQFLTLRALTDELGIEWRIPCTAPPHTWYLPLELFETTGGKRHDYVTLTISTNQRVKARWTEQGIPQARDFELLVRDDLPEFPERPTTWHTLETHFWSGLQAAMPCVDHESTRYALGCFQLRGSAGQLIATNGKELLIQGGFSFPWTDDVLIPANRLLGCADLAQEGNPRLALHEDWLVLKLGDWTLWNKIRKEARFPQTQDIFPSSLAITTRLHLDQTDAQFLNKALDSLPGQAEFNHPLTMDLNGHVALRGQAGPGTPATELRLSRSRCEGEQLRLVTNREYLARAVRLGFREIAFTSSHAPAVCRDEQRIYLWALLTPESAIRSAPEHLQIDSAQAEPMPAQVSRSRRNNRKVQSQAA